MPTVFRSGPYRFFFYSNEGTEPAHVHVERDASEAKLWLEPTVKLAWNDGFSSSELNKIEVLVIQNRSTILSSWHGYFTAVKRPPRKARQGRKK